MATHHHANRRVDYIRRNQHVFSDQQTKPRGSLVPLYFIDRTQRSIWHEEPEFPPACEPGEWIRMVRQENKKKVVHRAADIQKHVRLEAEPISYDWTPSCMLTDPQTGKQCWPARTEAVCWWDCHAFTWTPFPLPLRMRDMAPPFRERYVLSGEPCCEDSAGTGSSKIPRNSWAIAEHLRRKKERLQSPFVWDDPRSPLLQFECIGNFCGPSCALAYAQDKHLLQAIPLINTVARMYGYITPKAEEEEGYSRIVVAPPRELLRMFTAQEDGLEIGEFRMMCMCGIGIAMRDSVFITKRHTVEAKQVLAAYETRMAELNRAKQLKKMQQQQHQGIEIAKKLVGAATTEKKITTSEMLKMPKEARTLPKGKMTFDLLLNKGSVV